MRRRDHRAKFNKTTLKISLKPRVRRLSRKLRSKTKVQLRFKGNQKQFELNAEFHLGNYQNGKPASPPEPRAYPKACKGRQVARLKEVEADKDRRQEQRSLAGCCRIGV